MTRLSHVNARALALSLLILSLSAPGADATFSIIAYDAEAGEWGVAVASREIAVGHAVPWARAGSGVVATQAWISPLFGMNGLDMMEKGMSAGETMHALLEKDEEDETRQFALIDASGNVAAFSGSRIGGWSGDIQGDGFSIQGNCLAGEQVLREMERAFLETEGPLGLRLTEALLAGDAAGGDKRGRQSASLLVVRKGAGLRGVLDELYDLRVDNHPDAPNELAAAFEQWSSQVALYYYLEQKDSGDNDKGIALVDWIVEREKRKEEPDVRILYTMADMMSRLGLFPGKALEIALYMHGLLPDNAAVMSVMAESYFASGNTDAAVEWNKKALELHPDSRTIKEQAGRFNE